LDPGTQIHLKGIVIYIKRPFSDIFEHPSGMAIEFSKMNDDDRKILRDFIKRASAQDIPESKEETIFKPAL